MDGLQFEDFELEGGAPSQDGERDPSIDFSIKVISATVSDHGGVTNGKLVILFDLLINQFGNEDVIVGLNLDNICSTS